MTIEKLLNTDKYIENLEAQNETLKDTTVRLVRQLRELEVEQYKEQIENEVVLCNKMALELENRALKQQLNELEMNLAVLIETEFILIKK